MPGASGQALELYGGWQAHRLFCGVGERGSSLTRRIHCAKSRLGGARQGDHHPPERSCAGSEIRSQRARHGPGQLRLAADLREDRVHLRQTSRGADRGRQYTKPIRPVCYTRALTPLTLCRMASPIAHSFAGLWTFLCLRAHLKTQLTAHRWRRYVPQLLVLVSLANLPDLEFLFGFGFHANELHRGFTHSLTIATLISLTLSCAWRIVPGFWRSAILYFTAYSSHLLIDLFTGTKIGWTDSGFGMPLFWPWAKTFSSPLILVFGIHHKDFAALFSLDNVRACTYETLTFGAITVVASVLWKRKLKSRILRKAKPKSPASRPGPESATNLLSNPEYRKREVSTHLPKL